MQLRSDVNFSMPCGVIQHLPFVDQVKLVSQLGFKEFTLHQYYLGIYNMQGTSLADMKSMVADAGLRISRIDPLCTWVPEWQAEKFGHEFNLKHAMEVSEFLELSAFFDCEYLSLNAMWTAGKYSNEEIVGFYKKICDRAKAYDITCDIEAIPMWGIPHIDDALAVIRDAGVSNGGLVVDTTHITRGGTSMDTLRSIPSDLIHLVQICDGEIPSKISLEEECFSRMWPGEGDFAINDILSVLNEKNALRGVGPEVFSPKYEKEKTPASWIKTRTEECLQHYPLLLG